MKLKMLFTKLELIDFCEKRLIGKNKNFNPNYYKIINDEFINSLNYYVKIKNNDIKIKIYHLLNELNNSPKCIICNELAVFKNFKFGYSNYCSKIECRIKAAAKSCTGKKHSAEFVEKRISKLRGRSRSQEFCDKIKNLWKNDKNYRKKCTPQFNQEQRKKRSDLMKLAIAEGKFTPCITNSWTHFDTNINGKKFRSSFEGIFYIYKHLYQKEYIEYEKLRLPYILNNTNKIYIVDFIDNVKKCVYEIKPQSLVENTKNLAKNDALLKWSKENNFSFYYINENNIFNMYKEMQQNNFFHEFMNEFKGKYEKYL